MKHLLIIVGLMFASLGFAESQSEEQADLGVPETTAETRAQVPGAGGKFYGGIDFRPSVQTKPGITYSENQIYLGYQTNSAAKIGLVSDTNVHISSDKIVSHDIDPINLYSKLQVNDFYKIPGTSLTLSYENRVYAPINEAKRDGGMILAVRNYGKISSKLSEKVKLTLMEVPIFHVYNTAGTVAGGASPWAENRVYLYSEIQLGRVLMIPAVWWSAVKHRAYSVGAMNNDGWSHYAEFDLDVVYALNDHVGLGLGFYTNGNLFGSSNQGFYDGLAPGAGFKDGVAQVILQAAL